MRLLRCARNDGGRGMDRDGHKLVTKGEIKKVIEKGGS